MDYTGSIWLNCFDQVALFMLGLEADELNNLKETKMEAYEACFQTALGQTLNFRIRAKIESYQERTQTRNLVVKAEAINFARESSLLLQMLRK